jgi:hypothetical protein
VNAYQKFKMMPEIQLDESKQLRKIEISALPLFAGWPNAPASAVSFSGMSHWACPVARGAPFEHERNAKGRWILTGGMSHGYDDGKGV